MVGEQPLDVYKIDEKRVYIKDSKFGLIILFRLTHRPTSHLVQYSDTPVWYPIDAVQQELRQVLLVVDVCQWEQCLYWCFHLPRGESLHSHSLQPGIFFVTLPCQTRKLGKIPKLLINPRRYYLWKWRGILMPNLVCSCQIRPQLDLRCQRDPAALKAWDCILIRYGENSEFFNWTVGDR